ncbi:hypothetical protein AAMO2058_000869300 [Amorphochlora amoebiformis]|mmetsp:Transcript_5843/g.8950  ORF Transcript_5843/g.8950 Transcript_5843/m.8950 type:complete len:778 (-) Transcript_5843:44-2377(-)
MLEPLPESSQDDDVASNVADFSGRSPRKSPENGAYFLEVKEDDVSIDTSSMVIDGEAARKGKAETEKTSTTSEESKGMSSGRRGTIPSHEEMILVQLCSELLICRGKDMASESKTDPSPMSLSSLISRAKTQITSTTGQALTHIAEEVVALRQALQCAIQTLKNKPWTELSRSLETIDGILAPESPETFARATRESLEKLRKSFPLPECIFVRALLKARKGMEDWREGIEQSMASANDEDLKSTLNSYKAVSLWAPKALKNLYNPIHSEGKLRLRAISSSRERLEVAMGLTDIELLDSALEHCKALNMTAKSHIEVKSAELKLAEMKLCIKKLNEAIVDATPDREMRLIEALKNAKDLNFSHAEEAVEAEKALENENLRSSEQKGHSRRLSKVRSALFVFDEVGLSETSENDPLTPALEELKSSEDVKSEAGAALVSTAETFLALRNLLKRRKESGGLPDFELEAERLLSLVEEEYPAAPIVVSTRRYLPGPLVEIASSYMSSTLPTMKGGVSPRSILKSNRSASENDLENRERRVRFDPSVLERENEKEKPKLDLKSRNLGQGYSSRLRMLRAQNKTSSWSQRKKIIRKMAPRDSVSGKEMARKSKKEAAMHKLAFLNGKLAPEGSGSLLGDSEDDPFSPLSPASPLTPSTDSPRRVSLEKNLVRAKRSSLNSPSNTTSGKVLEILELRHEIKLLKQKNCKYEGIIASMSAAGVKPIYNMLFAAGHAAATKPVKTVEKLCKLHKEGRLKGGTTEDLMAIVAFGAFVAVSLCMATLS